MFPQLGAKVVASVMATGATTGETLTALIDRLGYDEITIDLVMTSVATNKQPANITISECDTSNGTFTSVLLSGTDFTIPAGNTSADNVYRFHIDGKARKRYLKLSTNPATTGASIMHATLQRAKETPITTTGAGVHLLVAG